MLKNKNTTLNLEEITIRNFTASHHLFDRYIPLIACTNELSKVGSTSTYCSENSPTVGGSFMYFQSRVAIVNYELLPSPIFDQLLYSFQLQLIMIPLDDSTFTGLSKKFHYLLLLSLLL